MTRPLGGVHSEFGVVLGTLVRAVPGARGAVLVDAEGLTIDFANDTEVLDELDLQIAGAQMAIPLLQAAKFALGRGLGASTVLVEGPGGCVVGAIIDDDDATLLLVLSQRANLGTALRRFGEAHKGLLALLR